MAAPTNPYKNQLGDGVHIPSDLISNVGEIAQRGLNDELVAIASGSEGQVLTYQADGTLAAADATGGEGGSGAQRTWTVRTANSLPGSRIGLDFDGITHDDGELVVTISSSGPNAVNQGVWSVHAGAWTRPEGFDTGDDVCGHTVYVTDGTNVGKEFVVTRRSSTASTAVVGTDGLAHSVLAGIPSLARFRSESFDGDETSSYVTTIDDVDAGQAVVQVYENAGPGFVVMGPDAVGIKVNGAVTLTFTDPTVMSRAYRVNIADAQ